MKKSVLLACFFLLVSSALLAGDGDRRCAAPADECATRIREMMTGQMFLGVIFYDSETGIYVKSVVDGSPAEEADLRAGDFIVAIEGKDISDGNVKAFKRIFGKAQKQGHVTLKVRRDETILTTTADLREIDEKQIARIIQAHLDAAHSDSLVAPKTATTQP
jgi:C-terminal processing protease CtpA/Prc